MRINFNSIDSEGLADEDLGTWSNVSHIPRAGDGIWLKDGNEQYIVVKVWWGPYGDSVSIDLQKE